MQHPSSHENTTRRTKRSKQPNLTPTTSKSTTTAYGTANKQRYHSFSSSS